MLRASIFAATVLAIGCPSKQPEAPKPVDDAPLRIRIANAEVKRAGGVAELTELAASTDIHTRELALRGLGRVGGAAAITLLEAALGDPEPRIAIAAATALGVVASLDETAKAGGKLAPLLASEFRNVRDAAAEALGRAGIVGEQGQLVPCARVAPACALALGRFGRRKLRLDLESRKALVASSTAPDAELRYAAVYALAREHDPVGDETVLAALVARITDEQPEIRATAINALAKRKALVGAARPGIEAGLRDADWRVAVEAARALASADDAGRTLLATSLAGKHPHVIHEALRGLAGKPLSPQALAAATALGKEPGWTGCLAAAAVGGPTVVDAITSCQLADHLKLPLLADIDGDVSLKRAALRVLLAHDDPRVRGAGITALAASWKSTEPRARGSIISTLTSSLASKNPIVAGSAVDAASALYEESDFGDPYRASLAAALVARANEEADVELAASLYGVIEKHTITAGLEACRAGLGGHAVASAAAAKCLRALGEAVPETPAHVPDAPPVDVATVIGRKVTWKLVTVRGEIVIELRPDVAPWSVASLAALTQRKYFDGLELHRVVPNFVAQGGDPTQSGWGGPGYTLPAEPAGTADGPGFLAGGLGVADAGPDSGGSQWFIMHSRAPHLDGRYTWIGRVTAGQAIADGLVVGDRVERATIEIR